MPIIDTSSWKISTTSETRLLHIKEIKIPITLTAFNEPNSRYFVVTPCGYLIPSYWSIWVGQCKRYAAFDVQHKRWIWSGLVLDRLTSPNSTLTFDREAIREKRKQEEEEFDRDLFELTKAENIPEDQWGSYQYPPQLTAVEPAPTALQRILVSRYWQKECVLIGASVGSGKTRAALDIIQARALHSDYANSVRIILVVAPLGLHENWRREFLKWKQPGVEYSVFRFEPTTAFWAAVEDKAATALEIPGRGIVIISTPQALSRPTVEKHFTAHNCVPTFIIVDEAHRFFRNPDNAAYKSLTKFRQSAHCIIELTGTPTAKLEDAHALESTLSPDTVWNRAPRIDYERLGNREFFTSSGLFQRGWTYERGIKEYHAHRIKTGAIFMADKKFYMKDSLPSLEQEELGDFADARLTFTELFDQYPQLMEDAYRLQLTQNPEPIKNDRALATTLLLRAQQIASVSEATQNLLKQFITDFLEPGEPCVFWTLFRNEPAEELPQAVRLLSARAPTGWLMGGMKVEERQAMIDGFMGGTLQYLVCQTEAAGVGLTLTRACKQLFLSLPFSYLTTCQCIGRLHRLGQENDVTSYFAMTHPIAAFARRIYDSRVELNETIPDKIRFDSLRTIK